MEPNQEYIDCESCGRNFSRKTEDDFRTKCRSCYIKDEKAQDYRKLVALESIAASLEVIAGSTHTGLPEADESQNNLF